MNRRLTSAGLLLATTCLFFACQEGAPEADQQDASLTSEGLALTGDPAIQILAPQPFTVYEITNPSTNATVTVDFLVSNWVYPSAGRAVWFLLDGQDSPPVSQTVGTNAITLPSIPKGLHTLTACLASGGNLLANQEACHTITIKVSVVGTQGAPDGCWPPVYDPQAQKFVCDPAHPTYSCCIDTNPCSLDACNYSMGVYKCQYGAVSSCCQSKYDCAFGQKCYSTDDPLTVDDDQMLNKCYECKKTSPVADQACDDGDACTVDTCGGDWFCDHSPLAGPQGQPCCVSDADCTDGDPCTIDQCANFQPAAGHGYCQFRSYQDIPSGDPAWEVYDQAAFQGCCTPDKILDYCDDHVLIINGQPTQDACWNAACVSNKCRYGKNPDPLCCNTAGDCQDCAEYDVYGNCLQFNTCTLNLCQDNHCVFEWNPFHDDTLDCCTTNDDCAETPEDIPYTLDWCQSFVCKHVANENYCNSNGGTACDPGFPTKDCPAVGNPCQTVTCDCGKSTCAYSPVPNCCNTDGDCDDKSACTTDVCNVVTHQCEHADIQYIGGKKCCDTVDDCFDDNICTTEQCVAHQCRAVVAPVNPADCGSGKCCDSNDDGNGNGSADDCESPGVCGAFQCVSHCCVPKTNLPAGTCVTNLDCEDGDSFTWNICSNCHCALQPPIYCDEAHSACNDSNPCTVDSCNFTAGLCQYVPKPNCCLAQADCVPTQPDACTNYQCLTNLNVCQNSYIPDCCSGDADAKCNDFDACTGDYCVNGRCRHQKISSTCCTSPTDCNDGLKCTQDLCVANECTHQVLPSAPDGTLCCTSDGACTDPQKCTLDTCINNECYNIEIDGCCKEEGEDIDQNECGDGNPCTADWCIYGKCRHFDPDHAPGTSHIPWELCCSENDVCLPGEKCDDSNICTNDVCVLGIWKHEPIDPCLMTLPYEQTWNVKVYPFEALGWVRKDLRGAHSEFNWAYSTSGPQGTDFHLRFEGITHPLDDFNAYMASPAFATHDKDGKQLFNTVTVQWENFLDLNQPVTTNLSLVYFEGDDLSASSPMWTSTTTADIENGLLTASFSKPALADQFRVAFNLNALYDPPGAQPPEWGSANHVNAWDIDNVKICGGNAPHWLTIQDSYGVFLDNTQSFNITALDPDPTSEVKFTLVGAPSFVSLVNWGYDWYKKSYSIDLKVAPAGDLTLGKHTFTIRASDGCLRIEKEISVYVFIPGGYLVWVPDEVSPLHGQRVLESILAQTDKTRKAQILADISAYPDLTLADGVFACMGVKGRKHTMTMNEAAALAQYLDQGGNLYIEGGDFWYEDPANIVQDYMMVDSTSGGLAKASGPVNGANFLLSGTPSTISAFAYNQLPYNPANADDFWNTFPDQLKVKEHTLGRVILKNGGAKVYPLGVSYEDVTDHYRTIGTSLPFGGYVNGASTRAQLMEHYLFFFEKGYPQCSAASQCDDGQECTIDACDAGTHVCNITPINCTYCNDDRDCDLHFGTDDYACLKAGICGAIPGYAVTSDEDNSELPIDFFGIPETVVVSSTITLGGTGAPQWQGRNVHDVSAKLRLQHQVAGELLVTLQHGFASVTLKASASTDISQDYFYTVDFGRDEAEGDMGVFDGGAIEGDWELTVEDVHPNNWKGGLLESWTLFVVPDDKLCTGDGECSDGNACTLDKCINGFCKNSLLDCIDYFGGLPNKCTADTCNPAVGCINAQKDCDDGNDCSIDYCVPDTGLCAHDWPPECHGACTTHADCGKNQHCVNGACEIIPGIMYDSPLTGAVAIPDEGAPLTSTMNIPVNDRMIKKLRVKVMVTHENIADLEVKLLHNAVEYPLVPVASGTGAGQHWVFSSHELPGAGYDEPTTDLGNDDPDQPTGFLRQSIQGEWTLSVQDMSWGNKGSLLDWLFFSIETYCFNNVDCDDSSLCTTDSCIANPSPDPKVKINIPKVCQNKTGAGECDNGLYCDGQESCNPLTGCIAGEPPALYDGNPCTDDICDEINDEVFHLPTDTYCNDNNQCTDDLCDVQTGGCEHINNTASCNDGIHCTGNDSCASGTCTGTYDNTIPGCYCNVDADCAIIVNPDKCVGSYVCLSHTCTINPATKVDCTKLPNYFKEPCAELMCDKSSGQCMARFYPQGVMCDDSQGCTINDQCNASGQCVGKPLVCDDNYWCNGQESCDPDVGQCVTDNVPPIDDGIDCTIDICDSAQQRLLHFPDDSLCDNGAFCDGLEKCDAATGCKAGTAPNCNDFNPCTDETHACDEATDSCVHNEMVAHCSWPCDGDHLYDAGDSDCGYDDACVGGIGATTGNCQPICSGANCVTTRSIQPNGAPLEEAIPDNDSVNCLVKTLNVSGAKPYVDRVDARVKVRHTAIMDLSVTLTDPDGYSVKAWNNYGSDNDNFTNTYWLSYPDTFQPMCAFRGDLPNGDWTLKICDQYPNNTGALLDWTLYVKGSQTDTSIGDRCDNALALNADDGLHAITGETTCAQEDILGPCGGTGKERVYRFNLADHKLLTLDMSTGKNWVAYVRPANGSTCADGALACDAAPNKQTSPRLHVELPPGTYYLVIDSNGDYGEFQANVTFKTLLPNGGACDNEDDCISDWCTDSTCCNAACTDDAGTPGVESLCMRCDGQFTPHGVLDKGTCTYISYKEDPENECTGTDPICGGACNGSGDCYKPGVEVPHVPLNDSCSCQKVDPGDPNSLCVLPGTCSSQPAITCNRDSDCVVAGLGGICQRCDGMGGWEYVPHQQDPFGQCQNRYCSGFQVYYEQRCSNDPAHRADRVGTCDCYDTKYGVDGCRPADPAPQQCTDFPWLCTVNGRQVCADGYMCDPTDGADDDFLPDDCRTACTGQAHCQYDGLPQGWYCEEQDKYLADGSFHTCKQRKGLGATCDVIQAPLDYGECVLDSGSPEPCVDGVCCNNTCQGLCMACDGVRTQHGLADKGTCTVLVGNANDTDAECYTADLTDCGRGWCAPDPQSADPGHPSGMCDWWGTGHVCNQGSATVHEQKCGTDNNGADLPSTFCAPNGSNCASAPDWVIFPADYCDDKGFCIDEEFQDCPGGFMCNDAGSACKTDCLTELDCAQPFQDSNCDGNGGVNYYCRDHRCNPFICDTLLDPTAGGQVHESSLNHEVEWSNGGSPQGCTGPGCQAKKQNSAEFGFYPVVRAKEAPPQYPNP
jgi:subtilisin-like proprotein convertase family protein